MIRLQWQAILQPNEYLFLILLIFVCNKNVKLEAVEIAETIFQTLEDLQRSSEEHSTDIRLLLAQLQFEKGKQDQCHHDTLEL